MLADAQCRTSTNKTQRTRRRKSPSRLPNKHKPMRTCDQVEISSWHSWSFVACRRPGRHTGPCRGIAMITPHEKAPLSLSCRLYSTHAPRVSTKSSTRSKDADKTQRSELVSHPVSSTFRADNASVDSVCKHRQAVHKARAKQTAASVLPVVGVDIRLREFEKLDELWQLTQLIIVAIQISSEKFSAPATNTFLVQPHQDVNKIKHTNTTASNQARHRKPFPC